jgi:hypothetical protein
MLNNGFRDGESQLLLKVVATSALCLLGLAQSARAFDPSDPPSDAVINNTLQCEAGRVGQALKRKKLPQDLQVAISWSVSKTQDSGWGFGIRVPYFQIGFDAGTTQQNLDEASSTGVPFNMHPRNADVYGVIRIRSSSRVLALRIAL